MPIKGLSWTIARVLAAVIPTIKAPTKPGATVAAIPSISDQFNPVSCQAFSRQKLMVSRCCREAISGTTPP